MKFLKRSRSLRQICIRLSSIRSWLSLQQLQKAQAFLQSLDLFHQLVHLQHPLSLKSMVFLLVLTNLLEPQQLLSHHFSLHLASNLPAFPSFKKLSKELLPQSTHPLRKAFNSQFRTKSQVYQVLQTLIQWWKETTLSHPNPSFHKVLVFFSTILSWKNSNNRKEPQLSLKKTRKMWILTKCRSPFKRKMKIRFSLTADCPRICLKQFRLSMRMTARMKTLNR